jgi:hypothetical protein
MFAPVFTVNTTKQTADYVLLFTNQKYASEDNLLTKDKPNDRRARVCECTFGDDGRESGVQSYYSNIRAVRRI